MEKSLLLHALSLHDMILEPTALPLQGRVWGYAKRTCGREAFVGHCLTMLSMLGMQASDISLKEDIVAFDAKGTAGTYTVVISLSDDSLASKHFYFLGLWQKSERMQVLKPLQDLPMDADLLQADFHYEVLFSDVPMRSFERNEILQGEMFGHELYGGDFCLISNGALTNDQALRFIIAPRGEGSDFVKEEVRHALYSLRNLMALSSAALHIHRNIWSHNDEEELYKDVFRLMHLLHEQPTDTKVWDGLVREHGTVLLRAAELAALQAQQQQEMQGLKTLFSSILEELHYRNLDGMAPLWPRMQLPFSHTASLLSERSAMLRRSQKQAELLLQLLHSRMLANQQRLLEALVNKS